MIKNVYIIGGTHGNEKTGVYIVDHIRKSPFNQYSFEVTSLYGNDKAIENHTRYVDFDFNRSFSNSDAKNTYEEKRSEYLAGQIKDPETSFVIDLHTTTTNMGVTYILSKSDDLSKRIAYLSHKARVENYLLEAKDLDQNHFVNRIAKHGFMIEVGPVAQNLYCAKTIEKTWQAVLSCLNLIDQYNQGSLDNNDYEGSYYKEIGFVDYPRDSQGEMSALIHPEFYGRDYQEIKKGDPVFYQIGEKPMPCLEAEGKYASFINEAAYYEKQIAFMLLEKKTF